MPHTPLSEPAAHQGSSTDVPSEQPRNNVPVLNNSGIATASPLVLDGILLEVVPETVVGVLPGVLIPACDILPGRPN